MTLLRSLVFTLATVFLPCLAHGIEPFSTDFAPKLTFTENYDGAWFKDGEDFDVKITDKVKISGSMSLQGVDLASLNASTPWRVEIGDLILSGSLGKDPAYTPGITTATFPVIGSDFETGAPQQIGTVVLSWTPSALVVAVNFEAEDDFWSPLAWWYDGDDTDGETILDDSATASVAFADRVLDWDYDFTLFAGVLANLREVKPTPDNWLDEPHVTVSGEIDSKAPTVTVPAPKLNEKVLEQIIDIVGTAADDLSGIDQVCVRLNGGDWQDATGFEDWIYASAQLKAGTNVLEVVAIDAVGLQSAILKRTFTFDAVAAAFAKAAGTYAGRFTKKAGTYRCVGTMTAATTAAGAISGTIVINGARYAVKGAFNNSGVFTKKIIAGGKVVATLSLRMNITSPDGTLLGSLSYKGRSVPVRLYKK